MQTSISQFLSDLRLGEIQFYRNMGVVPLFTPRNGGPDYLLMQDALEKDFIEITEVDSGGSVPNLKVINQSNRFILLLDGEEVMGAKQNRVLNASILLGAKSETVLPVSCTEQGRWSYVSDKFSSSGHVLSHAARSGKSRSVLRALERKEGYQSDQGEVWGNIASLHMAAHVSSPTGAMRDVYEAKEKDLKSYLGAFQPATDQKGILVLINGQAVGMDILSRPDAYGALHSKLVKSYAIDALVQQEKDVDEKAMEEVWIFLKDAKACKETRHESVGVGMDLRFEQPKMVGSALTHGESFVHLALFKTEENEAGRFSSFRARRENRRRQPSG
jgi:hypothetical protein